MILSQFHWLVNLVDNERLTNKILEVLTVCTPQLKKELLSLIPDLLEDSSVPVRGIIITATS